MFTDIELIVKLGNLFQKKGYELYLVGGSVRDILMFKSPSDYDFATNARPDAIKEVLNSAPSEKLTAPRFKGQPKVEALWGIGEQFGTIGAIVDGMDVEITTYRAEQYRQNDRKPEVTFGNSIEEDLDRRDFTMNAIAMNTQAPFRYKLTDPHGGKVDIDSRTVRFVGHPKLRIMEDPLRMLRAIRFWATLDMSLDSEAHFWITSQSYMIRNISQERVQEELNKMLLSKYPGFCIRMLYGTDLLQLILPEIANLNFCDQDTRWHFSNVFEHTIAVLDKSTHTLEQRLAALFHDVGKMETRKEWRDGRVTFYGHEKVGATMTSSAMRRLKYSNGIRGRVCHMVRMHMRPLSLAHSGMSRRAVRKFIRDCYDNKYGVGVADIMMLNRADILGHKNPDLTPWDNLWECIGDEQENTPVQDLESPLDGNEIMALYPDFPAGPWVGEVKRFLTEEVVCGRLDANDKKRAEGLARLKVMAVR